MKISTDAKLNTTPSSSAASPDGVQSDAFGLMLQQWVELAALTAKEDASGNAMGVPNASSADREKIRDFISTLQYFRRSR